MRPRIRRGEAERPRPFDGIRATQDSTARPHFVAICGSRDSSARPFFVANRGSRSGCLVDATLDSRSASSGPPRVCDGR